MARCAVPVAERSVRRRNEWRCASYPARFVAPAPCGHGQHSSLSSTIFETAISGLRNEKSLDRIGRGFLVITKPDY
jgi:hypothetical protein